MITHTISIRGLDKEGTIRELMNYIREHGVPEDVSIGRTLHADYTGTRSVEAVMEIHAAPKAPKGAKPSGAYVAHNFAARLTVELKTAVNTIEQNGIDVTSRWLSLVEPVAAGSKSKLSSMFRASEAEIDRADIDAAEWLLFFADQVGKTPGRGKWFELGYAFAQGKKIIVISPRPKAELEQEMVFFALPGLRFATSVEEAILIMKSSA